MRNNFLNLVAKMPQNTGGGTSRTKNRSVTVNLSSDTTTNREMTERRPREDRETFRLRSSLLGTLKCVACMLLALVLGVGNIWGQTTFTAQDFLDAKHDNSEHATCSAASGLSLKTGSNQLAYYSSTNLDGIQISSSTTNQVSKGSSYVEVKADKGYAVASIEFKAVVENSSDAAVAIVGWNKGINSTACDYFITPNFPKKNNSSAPANTVVSIEGNYQTIRIYRQILINANKTFASSSSDATKKGAGKSINLFEAIVTTKVAPVIEGDEEMLQSETLTLKGYPAGGTWAIESGTAASINSTTGAITSNATSGDVEVSYTVGDKKVTHTITVLSTTTKTICFDFTKGEMPTASGIIAQGNGEFNEYGYNLATADANFAYVDVTAAGYEITAANITIFPGGTGDKTVKGDFKASLTDATSDGWSISKSISTKNVETDYGAIPSLPEGCKVIRITKGNTGCAVGKLCLTVKKYVAPESHHVTYDLNGGTGVAPTQADVAQGGTFTVAAMPGGVTPPTGTKFSAWNDGNDDYEAGDTYTMGTSNVTLTAQWVENVPDPTATFANASYIIGASALDMSAKFTSNSTGSVTYSLKEATTNATITSAGAFTATAAGEYVVVASQAAVTGSYAAISKEATVTVLDNELSDIYIWQKNSSNGGDGKCVTGDQANQNINANAASTTLNYTTLTMDGMSAMGRPAAAGDVKLTFAVRNAYNSIFGITSVCAYGKIEETGGIEYSWNNVDWAAVAGGEDANNKHEFVAPAGTFPENFYIRFTNAETGKGGLWLRNALVTLQVKKTVIGTVEELTNVKVNGIAIDAADLATLMADKSVDITTEYALAPTITFVKQVTTSYSGGWADDVTSEEIDVLASEVAGKWQASQTINAQTYTVTLTKPSEPSLLTEATSLTLTSAKVATDTESFTFSGVNLGTTDVTISLENAVAGMTVSPAVVTPEAGAITDQEVTVTYKSLEDVASANVNLVVYYDESTKLVIPLTYSSTAGIEDLTPISAATTWNWTNANSGTIESLDANNIVVLANVDGWAEGFNANAIAGRLQYYYRGNNYAQGHSLKFNTTVPGKVFVSYSNTGDRSETDPYRAARITDANDTYAPTIEAGGSKNTTAKSYSHLVAAGDVLIEGYEMKEPVVLNMLRFYEVRFAPVFAVTYAAGDGAVKSGETMPTQADEAAGEKIILAAATVLEKDGYDFAGWLCDIDGQTYQPGDEYEMTAAATTFTAQWVLHVDPVDPTLTYNEGAYMVGASALDLSTLISASNSTGAITYSVKDAGTTGATITDGKFTATAAGTAIITASQVAVLGYNAKEVDFNVVVTVATEIDGIKLVEAGALTGKFVTASTLSDGAYTIEGIHYEKYLKFGSTFSGSYGNGARTNYIFYDLKKENTTFYVYAHNNTSTAGKIIVYTYNTASAKYAEVPVVASENAIKSFSLNDIDANTRVFIGVDNTNIYFCQVVAVESGADLMKAGEPGYSIDFGAKSRFTAASNTAIDLDGMEFVTSSGYTPNSSTEVGLGTIGTNYVKFKLDAPTTVEVKTNSTNQYYIGSTYDADEATSKTYGYKPTSNGETHSFDLTAGTWYLNPNTSNIKLQKLAFMLPKCAEPSFDALANSDICSGNPYVALDGTATITDAGTVSYKWYAEGADESDPAAVIGTNATYLPSADGKYYVIATNSLSGYTDNVKKSDLVSVTTFASAAITAEPENVRMNAGEEATLTVAATGKNLSYEWFTCDDAEGTNPVAIVPAETGASLTVTVTAGMYQYYKVVVSSDCGDAFAVARVEEWSALPQVSVSATTTWDWQYAATTTIAPEKDVEILMANIKDGVKKMTNDETFNSQALLFMGQEAYIVENSRAFAKGGHIKFTTTVPGMVTVEFSDNGNNNRKLKINDAISPESSSSKTDVKTFSAIVPAGEVMLEGVNGDGTGNDRYIRISKIIFDANPDPAGADYSRPVTEGRFGTICLPNGGVMVGADIFEIAYYGESTQKVFLDNIINGEMEAGRPYIFLPKEGTTQLAVFYTDEANASQGNHNGLIGFIGDAEDDYFNIPADEGNYILQNNYYREVPTGAWARIKSNRAYIKLSAINPHESALAPGRRRISMSVYSEQVATSIENTGFESEAPVKVMIDGQLFIIRGEKMYNANGQLVK